MVQKSVEMQLLRRGRQPKRTVELAEHATAQDVVRTLAALSGAERTELFLAERRGAERAVKLFGGEAPQGDFEVGGLESLKESLLFPSLLLYAHILI